MTPQKAYQYVLLGMVVLYGAKLVVGRFVVLYNAYGDARSKYKEHDAQFDQCLEDDRTFHTFGAACKKAERGIYKWPFITALGTLVQETHSCVDYPCTDLVTSILSSWVATLCASMMILVLFFYVFVRLFRWKDRYAWNSLSRNGNAIIEPMGQKSFFDREEGAPVYLSDPDTYAIDATNGFMINPQHAIRQRLIMPYDQ